MKRVLYVAAHPDDENTRALAYFSLGEKAETAYFSLTRGDGGQNLIGDELSEDLGILRTQELLAARSYDGAKQYFSRALDFGYSKSAEESFELWGKDELLHDLVQTIRTFQPDVIITRFPPDERAGHGHHTASALLAIEAFNKAADPEFLPEQVNKYGVWQTTSIYWNTSYWWDKDIQNMAEGDPNYIIMDIGGYNAQLGMSYNEIGTLARSQHKCQGFGAVLERGSRIEYFKHLDGKKLKGFFDNNETSWSNLINPKFASEFNALLQNFNFQDPSQNVSSLLAVLKGLEELPASFFKEEKIKRCKEIIIDCLGLHAELNGNDYSFVANQDVELNVNLINRADLFIQLEKISLSTGESYDFTDTLTLNKSVEKKIISNGTVSQGIFSQYWLEHPFKNLFEVSDSSNYCRPENKPVVHAVVTIKLQDKTFDFEVPATYKWRDPSYGERERPMIATPLLAANFEQKLVLLKPGEKKTIRMKIHAFEDSLSQLIEIKAPKGWGVYPNSFELDITNKHSEEWLTFELEPLKGASSGDLQVFCNGEKVYSYTEIVYDHIPTQGIFKEAAITCTELDVKITPGKIAYIKGVDDAVPQAIAQLGFDVETFEVEALSDLDLGKYRSVVLGIRIYNVHPEIKNFDSKLFEYVENGGNLIMQYNTAWRSQGTTYGPYPFELSRKRVTEEDAEVTFLAKEHQIMNTPNKISKKDFEGWVQERGLYFADNWDEKYSPLFSWSDKGEDPVLGGLITCKHGKGQFVYTGISFFRELPNGVIGAYRLFANLLSYQP
ncbi:MAG: PIG-L deacetylase family protein [Crocinitomicaceae bacterium]